MDRPLQRIQHLPAGDLDHGQVVAVGAHPEDVVVADVPLRDVIADAAAGNEGNIAAALIQKGVGAQIAEVGLGASDKAHGPAVAARGLGIVHAEGIIGDRKAVIQQPVQLVGLGRDRFGRGIFQAEEPGGREAAGPGEELGGDLPLAGDAQDADLVELGAAGRADDVLPVPVLYDDLVAVVAVAVDPRVDAAAVGDHIAVHPGRGPRLVAQVAQHDHEIRACGAQLVGRLLYGAVDRLAGLVLHKAVDEIPVFILEVAREGRPDRVGGGDAHKADLHAADLFDQPGLQNRLAVFGEVAAEIGVVCLFGQGKELLHPVVKLVVAGDGRVVAHDVHDADNRFAPGQQADGLALDGVAAVNQKHVLGPGELLFDSIEAGIAPALINGAVDVACEEDDQIPLLRGRLGAGLGAQAHQKRGGKAQAENQGQRFFHFCSSRAAQRRRIFYKQLHSRTVILYFGMQFVYILYFSHSVFCFRYLQAPNQRRHLFLKQVVSCTFLLSRQLCRASFYRPQQRLL